MSHPELNIPVVINKTSGEIFAAQFMFASREIQPAHDHISYMYQIHFLETAAAQLAWSVSTHEFTDISERALRTKFNGYYNLNQIIADIRTHPRYATEYDTNMSGAADLAFVNSDGRRPTRNDKIHSALFFPFTLSFHPVESEARKKQEKQITQLFPNLRTQNPILFISPIVTISYPVTIQTYGHTGRSQFGELNATITTASARYVKTYKDRLVEGVHTRTIRTGDAEDMRPELEYLHQLAMASAQAREYNAMTNGVIYSGDMSGNSK